MSSRLDCVKDWAAIAAKCGYCVHETAKHLLCSERQLARHFNKHFGATPKKWMNAERARVAEQELARGELVKVVATNSHFRQRQNFAKFYKQHFGHPPTDRSVVRNV